MSVNNAGQPAESEEPMPKNMGAFVSGLMQRISDLEAERDVLGHIIRRREHYTKQFAADCLGVLATKIDTFSGDLESLKELVEEVVEENWENFAKSIPDTSEKWCSYCGLMTDHSSGGCMQLLHDRNAALEKQNQLLHRRIQQLASKSK